MSDGDTSHIVNGIIIQTHVHIVKPPETIPEYNAGSRVGPPVMKPQDLDLQNVHDFAMLTNLVWSLTRLSDTKSQSVSSWTGFNVKASDSKSIQRDTVGYLPAINAPATQLSTVSQVLLQIIKIKAELHLEEIVCVFHQALYAKAIEIKWKNSEVLKKIVIRMRHSIPYVISCQSLERSSRLPA